MVGWMPCFSQISLIGTCSKRCSRRSFAFSSGLYRLRGLLLMLLFLGRGKGAYLKTLKRTFQLKQNSQVGRSKKLSKLSFGAFRFKSCVPGHVGSLQKSNRQRKESALYTVAAVPSEFTFLGERTVI